MDRATRLLANLGLGAALMYLLDPVQGRNRRVALHALTYRGLGDITDALRIETRQLLNSAHRVSAKARSLRAPDERPTDEILVARIRSAFGKIISHPHSVQVAAHQGTLTLSGTIHKGDLMELMICASSFRGVTQIINHLDIQESVGNPVTPDETRTWHPGMRLRPAGATRPTLLVAGGLLSIYGLSGRRGSIVAGLGGVGIALFARALARFDANHRASTLTVTLKSVAAG